MTDENNQIGKPKTIFERLEAIDSKVDRLEARVNWLFGALAVLSVLGNLIVPLLFGNRVPTP